MSELPPGLRAELDQAMAAARQVRADAPGARAERRCAVPPMGCGQPLGKPLSVAFRDQASRDEYDITGLCQGCQDEMWAPPLGEVYDMFLDVERYGRCFICGEFRPYEFVDVGVGVIRGFDCCESMTRPDTWPKVPCGKVHELTGERCHLIVDHAHLCDFGERELFEADLEERRKRRSAAFWDRIKEREHTR